MYNHTAFSCLYSAHCCNAVELNPPSDSHAPHDKPHGMHHIPALSFHGNATQASYNTALWLVQMQGTEKHKVIVKGLQPYRRSPAVIQIKCWPAWMQSVCSSTNAPRTRWIWAILHHFASTLGITPHDIAHIFYCQMRKPSRNYKRQAKLLQQIHMY